MALAQLTNKTQWTRVKHKERCHNMGKWKHSANLPFTKSLNTSEHYTGNTASISKDKQCSWYQFPSRLTMGMVLANEIRLRLIPDWDWSHFLLFVYGVNWHFVFSFWIFYIWVNADTIGFLRSFKIHFWDSVLCWLTRKISLISLARLAFSCQPVSLSTSAIVILRQIFLPDTSLLRFGFKLIIVNLQRSMQNVLIDRVLPIMRHWDKILGGGGGGVTL